MPIYEYDCQRCGTFEATQRITDKPLVKCPTCRGKVRKLISNTSFQLKGTGWYITDYARKGKSEDGKSDATKSDGSSKPATESKGESKKSDAPSKSSGEKGSSASSSPST
jgi:putative FmdB family regulatory protein